MSHLPEIFNLEANDAYYYLSNSDLAKEISFLGRSMNWCIGFVDMVNSTSITAEMVSDRQKVRQYYSIFINTMAILAKNYGAKIVKTAGDALIFYFPDSSDSANEVAFKDILECFTTMLSARDIINAKLRSEDLPSVSYRISADYGRVEVATSTSSKSEDLFGSTMNICAKINSMAEPNGIVIGGNLYQIIESFSFAHEGYEFRELREGYSIDFDNKYPVYAVLGRNNNNNNNKVRSNIDNINQLFRSNRIKMEEDIGVKEQQSSQPLLQNGQLKHQQQQKYSSINILAVDDEPDTAYTYKSILSAEGYNVQVFTDAQEALKHFIQLPDPSTYYQLLILDIRMPRLNGLQLFNTIKAITPNTKIMFVSALDIAEEVISIFPDMKLNHIIKKPVDREHFIDKINSILDK
ncbi:MAG: response regulator [Thermoproteota archaeon]|nr:response regulator [Thermoproteota archaeon]